jgi:hypothetical protein
MYVFIYLIWNVNKNYNYYLNLYNVFELYNVQKQGIYFLWVGLFKKNTKKNQTKQNIFKDKYR